MDLVTLQELEVWAVMELVGIWVPVENVYNLVVREIDFIFIKVMFYFIIKVGKKVILKVELTVVA